MLISDVQIVKKGKAAANQRSVVRLYSVEHLPDVGSHVDVETWLLRPVLPDAIPPFENGKESLIRIVPLQPGELTGEVIEGASQIVDAVPEHSGERVGNRWGVDGVVDVLKALALDLGNEGVEVTVRDTLQQPVQSLAVTLCPPHFEIRGVEIGRLRQVHATTS